MAAWTGDIKGLGTGSKYPVPNEEIFQEPKRPDLYDKYVAKAAQAQGLIAIVYIPKDVAVAASDTFTLTVKAA